MVGAHCLWIAAFPSAAAASHMVSMAMPKPFFIANAKSKPTRTSEAVDVAARHLAYKLYEATNGQPGAWQALGEIGERPATVARAVERGWVIVRQDIGGRAKVQSASLTDEGRRLALKGLRG